MSHTHAAEGARRERPAEPAPGQPARPPLYALPDPDSRPPAPSLDGLDPEQREAVLHTDGPLLVIAGAGSGKTRVMTERTAHLIEQGIAHPGQILSITFTNKAAGEMRERLARRVGRQLAGAVTLGTFHALCARILRAHPGDSGRSARYSIYDEGDTKRVLERYLTRADKARIERDEVLAAISRAKNHLVPRERFASATPDELGGLVLHDDIKQIVTSVWAQVDAELERSDALDFDDLIGFTVALLERRPDVLAGYRRRWRYLQVDEHQDTNPLQDRLLRLLAGEHPNLMVVGDDQQCLAAGTLITMADGSRRAIEDIRPGDEVWSSQGRGQFAPARVNRAHRSESARGIAILTESKRRLVSTPEHVHFAGYRPGTTIPLFLTYLMRRATMGFRVGTTRTVIGTKEQFSGLGLRTMYERAAMQHGLSRLTTPRGKPATSRCSITAGSRPANLARRTRTNRQPGASGRRPSFTARTRRRSPIATDSLTFSACRSSGSPISKVPIPR